MGIVARILIAAVLLSGLYQLPLIHRFGQYVLDAPPVTAVANRLSNAMDGRPETTVLFIGDSRTLYNEMPGMVRGIADSAHDPHKYVITTYAQPGRSLKDHWEDPHVHELLKRKWDFVVLQGASTEQANTAMEALFYTYASGLAAQARSNGAKPVLLVAWRPSLGNDPRSREPNPQVFYARIQASYASVARATGAAEINVGRTWEKVLAQSAEPLMVDGNHPTVRGSYLVALMCYRFFSHADLSAVTYVPYGLREEDASVLKLAAMEP